MKGTHLYITAYARVLFILFILIMNDSSAFSQTKITGIIQGEGTITIKDSNLATLSAADGRFSISAKPGDVLIFSYAGMVEKSIQVLNQSLISIILFFDIASMEEVMIIGYGTARRKDVI